ncbi:MAG: prepilin-type N-terminal cleavage/methylation domain-containing protein [bacterium]
MKIHYQKRNTGFTLIETLVAISILSISILGTFTAVQTSLQSSGYAKDQVTAFYLAQESIEYLRNKRDENALNSLNSLASGGSAVGWLTGISAVATDPCYFGKVCTVDSPGATLSACSGALGSCPVLNQDSATGLFGYNVTWTPTDFKREIQLQTVAGNANEIVAIITVSWQSGAFSKTFQIRESLFNNR